METRAQTRSLVAVGGTLWYCVGMLHTVRLAHTRSVDQETETWYSVAGAQVRLRGTHTRSVSGVGGRYSTWVLLLHWVTGVHTRLEVAVGAAS